MTVPSTDRLKALNAIWMERMLYHSTEAIAASKKWQAAKQHVTDYIEINRKNFTSAEQRRERYKIDWAMQDAMDSWSWHERQAKLYASNLAGLNAHLCIQAQLADRYGHSQ